MSTTFSGTTPTSPSLGSFEDIGSRDIGVQFSVGSTQHLFQIRCHEARHISKYRDQFLQSRLSSQESSPDSAGHLGLQFLEFLLQQNAPTTATAAFLSSFDQDILNSSGIHSLVQTLPGTAASKRSVLQSYYAAADSCNSFRPRQSALVEAARRNDIKLYALFGRQCSENPDYLQDLIQKNATYRPFLADLIDTVAARLYELSCLPEMRRSYYQEQSFDLHKWLLNPSTVPRAPHFCAGAPVSLPLRGILDLADFCIACKILGKTPGELAAVFQGVGGHSSGIVVATVIAAADSWTSFHELAQIAVEILFWIGFETHAKTPRGPIPLSLIKQSVEKGYGHPSSMLSVRGLEREQIEAQIRKWNQNNPSHETLFLSIATSRHDFGVSGPAIALIHFNSLLEDLNAGDKDQTRVPFSKRKPVIAHRFQPGSILLHTPYLQEATLRVKEALAGQAIPQSSLRVPVYHSRTGKDLRQVNINNLIDVLIDATMTEPCNLHAAITFPNASHIVSFGTQCIGELVLQLKEGHGVRVILGNELESHKEDMATQVDFFSPQWLPSSNVITSWADEYRPHLNMSSAGDFCMETRFTQLLGTPPVMVAGMTPTTAHWDVVAAVRSAGYHVELASGGYHNAAQMTEAINKIAKSTLSTQGITCNLIYANPRAMAWQIALLQQLSLQGSPVDGLTIGAGVPSPEVVAGYIRTLRLRHISFKPGLLADIYRVIDVAKAHPKTPIILQWTGGRAGGHHSSEDFHLPILKSYAAIRSCANIVLVAGSGFGTGDETYKYFTGSWSSQRDYAPMPFDGILLGSRIMTARETHTSPAVKKYIAAASGIPDKCWEETYNGAAGGIISVISEMGQPMHKIATRGVLLWAEMDKTIFSLPRKDRVAALVKNRASIISRLNADFAKPWFGRNAEGQVLDVWEMTYSEVLLRLVQLMYVRHEQRWISPSYLAFFADLADRVLERLPVQGNLGISLSSLDSPDEFLMRFHTICPQAATQILDPEDVSFFFMRCKAHGQKPINFIPSLDEDFEYYFKKDSLWQSEDIEGVVDQDAGRVCILHGPVAAQYSREGDESVKDILDDITKTLVERLRHDHTEISNRKDTTLAADPGHQISSLLGAERLPGWAVALFTETHMMQIRNRRQNPFNQIFPLLARARHTFSQKTDTLSLILEPGNNNATELKMVCRNGFDISVELCQPSAYHSEPAILALEYSIQRGDITPGLSEVMEGRNKRIKSFYSHLWFGKSIDYSLDVHSIFHGPEVHLTADLLKSLMSAVERAQVDRQTILQQSGEFPIGVGMFLASDVLLKPLTLEDIDGDLLRLVHQSNAFEYCDGEETLRVGDIVRSRSRVQAVQINKSGKKVMVEAHIERQGQPVMKITSTFLFRGQFEDFSSTFRHTTEPDMLLDLPTSHDESIFRSKKWYVPSDASQCLVGKTLLFRLKETVTWKDLQTYQSMSVQGSVYEKSSHNELYEVGAVDFTFEDCVGNPVMDYLQRKGRSAVAGVNLEHSGWPGQSSIEVQMPTSNEKYGSLSRDFNPIHVSGLFASWAELPGTITHGMYTSLVSADALQYLVAENRFSRVRRWKAQFTGMVLPSDQLTIRLEHTGMCDGRMIFQVSAVKHGTDEIVLAAIAELEQPRTAYIFTGQGSQVQGMGMDLYNSSSVTKKIWDTVDKHFHESYGWSIISIIKDNPKMLTVHFRGKRGRKMRENYLALEVEESSSDGRVNTVPILRNLSSQSQSYTFSEAGGLLFSTQFAQLAILLYEVAAFEELRSKGMIQRNAIYAGHSLGEYAAIWAFSSFLPLLSLMELIFYRGLTMQTTMSRDEHGSTNFGMVAANPMRVGKWCNEKYLACIVKMIATESQSLLEIVNFNVEGEQYVCAGTMQNLYVLSEILDKISTLGNEARSIMDSALQITDARTNALRDMVVGFITKTETLPMPIKLQRGKATIPLQGIDVPFHSTQLLSGVPAFRSYLHQQVAEEFIHPERLIGRWIPNLLAAPFSVKDKFVQDVLDISNSPVLGSVLAGA